MPESNIIFSNSNNASHVSGSFKVLLTSRKI